MTRTHRRYRLAPLAVVFASVLGTSACVENGGEFYRITVPEDPIRLGVGEQTRVLVYRENALASVEVPRPALRIGDPTVARLDGQVVTGVAPGRTKLYAQGGGFDTTADVVVETGSTVSELTAYVPPVLTAFETQHARVGVRSRYGVTLITPPVDWSSADSSIATVAPDGRVTGRGQGRTQIRARAAGVDGAGDVCVTTRPPAVVTFDFTAPARVFVGTSFQLDVVRKDFCGRDVFSSVEWSALDPAVQVSPAGVGFAARVGTGRLVARLGAFLVTRTVEVVP